MNKTNYRTIPKWAAGLISCLSRDKPSVVTLSDLSGYLAELGDKNKVEIIAYRLQQLGWLSSLNIKGVWEFIPAGHQGSIDIYRNIRGWKARNIGIGLGKSLTPPTEPCVRN